MGGGKKRLKARQTDGSGRCGKYAGLAKILREKWRDLISHISISLASHLWRDLARELELQAAPRSGALRGLVDGVPPLGEAGYQERALHWVPGEGPDVGVAVQAKGGRLRGGRKGCIGEEGKGKISEVKTGCGEMGIKITGVTQRALRVELEYQDPTQICNPPQTETMR